MLAVSVGAFLPPRGALHPATKTFLSQTLSPSSLRMVESKTEDAQPAEIEISDLGTDGFLEPKTGKVPAMMDEGIYGFNKFVIDTVYDIICLIYPVTGGKRDFARFYVLETVARVPYFAYLSVMHLR